MLINSGLWVRLSLVNLCIVALLGTLMRYKIGFEFPYFDQKHIQEAHSHFAFTGWITHTLYVLIVLFFRRNLDKINEKIYGKIILANLICSYGMLISFFIQGYGLVSILFSTLSILTGYVFAFIALKDTSQLPTQHPAKNWLKGAIWFSVISTIGTMVLSNMMASRQYDQTTYLGSIYFYLHFQYNGWFLFACMGLFLDRIKQFNLNQRHLQFSFWFFFLAGIVGYLLSVLWVGLPWLLYVFVVLAAVIQIIGWWYLVRMIRLNADKLKTLFSKVALFLFLIVALAFSLKLLLQLASTIPFVSKLAFSFRPIVIAYLHLVLLLIITVFLLTFMFATNLLHQTSRSKVPLLLFVAGVILNESVLAIQGIASFSYTIIPYVNEILFVIALMLLAGSFFLLIAHLRTKLHDANQLTG